ncbi:MAG TPA: hypothetical protein VGG68_09705 [Caulobacteraceae bacterium]|jgi:hypothetical protein
MKLSRLLIVSAAAAMFAGCTAHLGPGYAGVVVGPVADVDYDAYYDGYYGPIYDGYWGDDGVFIYRTNEGGHWMRGDTTHFRHDTATGFNHIRGTARAQVRPARTPG